MEDSLEGITLLREMIAAVIRSARVDEALYIDLRFCLDDVKERMSRREFLRLPWRRSLGFAAA